MDHRLARNTAQLVRIADVGIANATSGFLLPIVQLPGLVASFVTILIILVIAQPLTAAITVAYLGAIIALLYWSSRASRCRPVASRATTR